VEGVSDSVFTPWREHLSVRRVHVRQDSEGRWFWYHPCCSGANAGIGGWAEAGREAAAHAALGVCPAPEKPYGTHIAVDPDENGQRASWLCPDCKQYCASHNPCDCCMDAESDDQ